MHSQHTLNTSCLAAATHLAVLQHKVPGWQLVLVGNAAQQQVNLIAKGAQRSRHRRLLLFGRSPASARRRHRAAAARHSRRRLQPCRCPACSVALAARHGGGKGLPQGCAGPGDSRSQTEAQRGQQAGQGMVGGKQVAHAAGQQLAVAGRYAAAPRDAGSVLQQHAGGGPHAAQAAHVPAGLHRSAHGVRS